MAAQIKYPIGVQEFEKLRNQNYMYIDKTSIVRQMVESGNCIFLSRPRRFGKSLLVSTLKAYFEGKRELFRGMAIDSDEVDWTPSPVLLLDLNTAEYKSRAQLEAILRDHLNKWEKEYGSTSIETDLPLRFKGVIESAHKRTGQRVAVLVDEYDKPLLQAIETPELMEEFRSLLKSFYGVLKTADAHVRFALITGVTKFSKVSIFSDLNNLKDISSDVRFAEICGITEQELHDYFDEQIALVGDANGMTKDEAYAKMKKMYDGYHFTRYVNTPGIYNPFSVLCALDAREFRDYWFATGTPSFLIEVLKQSNYQLDQLMEQPTVTSDLLGEMNSFSKTPLPILYQSGYLTIRDFDAEFNSFTLGFPNYEVEYGFFKYLTSTYIHDQKKDQSASPFHIEKFVKDIREGRADDFMQRLDTFLVDGDYQIAGNAELYFQNVVFVVFKLLGYYVMAEHHTSRGRVDLLLQTRDYIYVIELKLDGSVEDAMKQIVAMEYAKPFDMDGRKVITIGANFSSETRHLTKWQIV